MVAVVVLAAVQMLPTMLMAQRGVISSNYRLTRVPSPFTLVEDNGTGTVDTLLGFTVRDTNGIPTREYGGLFFRDPQVTQIQDLDEGYYYHYKNRDAQLNTLRSTNYTTAQLDAAFREQGDFGYPLPFDFRFNNNIYNRLHININGFVTFPDQTQLIPNRQGNNLPQNLFDKAVPNAVLAVFWGDHHARFGTVEARDIDNLLTNNLNPAGANTLQNPCADVTNDYLRRCFRLDSVGGFTQTLILVKVEGTAPNRVMTIEWRNLNINIDKILARVPVDQDKLKSSIGTFQLKLYETTNDIEFHYGTVGSIAGAGAEVNGAAIGMESEIRFDGVSNITTYYNAVFNQILSDPNDPIRNTTTQLSTTWQPSGSPGLAIKFEEDPLPISSGWGDGDANLSQIRDEQLLQPFDSLERQRRFVSYGDAIMVLRNTLSDKPLDSIGGREAYHADVNHNGRFYYSNRKYNNSADSLLLNQQGQPILDVSGRPIVVTYRREEKAAVFVNDIYWRNPSSKQLTVNDPVDNEREGLPADSSLSVIYYQADEFDAALILSYLSAKVPQLPWYVGIRKDTVIDYGRFSSSDVNTTDQTLQTAATNLAGSNGTDLSLSTYHEGAFSLLCRTNVEVDNININPVLDAKVMFSADMKSFVIYGNGNVDANEVIATLTAKNSEDIEFNYVRINGFERESTKLDSKVVGQSTLSIQPNLISDEATVSFTAEVAESVQIELFDMLGNKVMSNSIDANSGANFYNLEVAALNLPVGSYLVKVQGSEVNASQFVRIAR